MKLRALFCLFAAIAGAALAAPKLESDPLSEAITLREGVALALIRGEEKPEAGMAKLRGHASPSGLKVDREADFALAAIDVGLRLLAADRAALAEEFFLEAEKSLVKAVKKTKDDAAAEKALYLQQLAFIRSNFLNRTEAASEDLEAALKLQPDDDYLKSRKAHLFREKAEQFKAKSKN